MEPDAHGVRVRDPDNASPRHSVTVVRRAGPGCAHFAPAVAIIS